MVGILFVRLSNGIGNLLFKLIEVIYYGLSWVMNDCLYDWSCVDGCRELIVMKIKVRDWCEYI